MAQEKVVIFHHDERGIVRSWSEVGELVRCKDCKYYDLTSHECEGIGHWFGLEDEWSDIGFCFKGERREEDD